MTIGGYALGLASLQNFRLGSSSMSIVFYPGPSAMMLGAPGSSSETADEEHDLALHRIEDSGDIEHGTTVGANRYGRRRMCFGSRAREG